MRDYLPFIAPRKLLASLGVLLAGVAGILEGTALLLLLAILDGRELGWLGGGEYNYVLGIGLFVVLGLVSSLARLSSQGLFLNIRVKVEREIRESIVNSLIAMRWPSYIDQKIGDLGKAVVFEGYQIATSVLALLTVAGAVVAALGYLVISVIISIEMTIYTLLFGVVAGFIYKYMSKRIACRASQLSPEVSNIGTQVNDLFSHMKWFRASGCSSQVTDLLRGQFTKYANLFFHVELSKPVLRTILECMGVMFVAAFIAYGILGEIYSVASILVFLAIFYRLIPRLMEIQQGLFQIKTNHSYFESWKDRAALAVSLRERHEGSKFPSFKNAVGFKDINFRYKSDSHLLFKKFNLTLKKNEFVAVVGASGSGKSTLVDLLSGLLIPETGEVLVDGEALSELDIDQWRKKIAVVLQDPVIFRGTIAENIAWRADEYDQSRLTESARMAHVMEFAERLPDGLNAQVGEGGAGLSGGQRQRISLARAFYSQPELLILDEVSSALDMASESAIVDSILHWKGRSTILMIAHRLNSVKEADRIIVLDKGRIAEEGNWDSLLQIEGGKFRSMVNNS